MIPITLHNDDVVDLFVSAVDNNQPGTPVVFPNQRLNQGMSSAAFNVQEDGNGNFSITTTATDVNDATRTKTQQHSGSSGDSVPVECS
jgi:hypothetical protein